MIIAKKGNLTKTFSPISWENLGPNKNGWVEDKGVITANAVKTPPPTGQKKAAVNDLVTENIADKVVAAPVLETANAVKTDEANKEAEIAKFIADQKEAFKEVAKAISPNLIKDYFDLNEVKYKVKEDLTEKLFENLGGDIELLKSKFSL